MLKLFATKLDGLQPHYADIIATLKSIEMHAINIVRADDYDELPFEGMAFCSNSKAIIVNNDIFNAFKEIYKGYYDYAVAHFTNAQRSDHSEILNEIYAIVEDFGDLAKKAIDCELDLLLRLWFFQIWQSSAANNEATYFGKDDKERYDLSVLTHLAYTTHHTISKLEKYFGYLAN